MGHVVLVCSCGEEKIISGDICVWLCWVESLVDWLVLFMQLFCYGGTPLISVLGSEACWVVGVEIAIDYKVRKSDEIFKVWAVMWECSGCLTTTLTG